PATTGAPGAPPAPPERRRTPATTRAAGAPVSRRPPAGSQRRSTATLEGQAGRLRVPERPGRGRFGCAQNPFLPKPPLCREFWEKNRLTHGRSPTAPRGRRLLPASPPKSAVLATPRALPTRDAHSGVVRPPRPISRVTHRTHGARL